jgi:serine protease Do
MTRCISLKIAAAAAVLCMGSVHAEPAQAPTPVAPKPAVDVVHLLDGRTIEAPILKETSETIWLDLGHEVIALPRNRIESIDRAEQTDASAEDKPDERQIYQTALRLPESTPQELAKKYGEAVIMVSTPSGLGSGFIVSPDGYAVTNAHVIQGETKIKATVYEQRGREFRRLVIEDVEIVAVNNHTDLALIKMKHPDGAAFPIVFVQGAEELAVGQDVFAIGSPLGLERTLSRGVIATTQRNFEGLTYIQTTAEINPGNSGGPLFNLKGEVIGVTNMGVPGGEGLGFAIPARYVRDFLRNRDAFAYDKDNPNSGYAYKPAPPRTNFEKASELDDATSAPATPKKKARNRDR